MKLSPELAHVACYALVAILYQVAAVAFMALAAATHFLTNRPT